MKVREYIEAIETFGVITNYKGSDGILYWVSKILFLVVLVGGPVLCIINL